jgi:hypothetical protein
MTVPDATPMETPALSPLVMGIMVPRLCAGIHIIKVFLHTVPGFAIGPIAILGYGTGIGGAGGAGVRHTSGNAISVPIN